MDKQTATKIEWNDGCNPTIKKQKKKKKGKKVTVESKQDSFFNIFCDLENKPDDKKDKTKDDDDKKDKDDDEPPEEDIEDRL